MGIQGLLKGLQGYSEKSSIRRFSHQSIAVDASSWLHKSVYSISEKYVESSEVSRTDLDASTVRVATEYMQRRCQELFSSANIAKIYLVFDGKRCPLKAATNDDREERRNKHLKEARLYKRQGRRDKAEEKYKMCIKIHSAFANAVAERLMKAFARDSRFKCVFSPYEADAQLAKLCVDGIANAIITEDSDVLVYSATCHISIPVIYKLDRTSGDCDVVSMDWLICATNENRPSSAINKKPGALATILQSLADRQTKHPGLGVRLFVQACVLAGSDYSPNKLNGVGLVTAFKMLRDNAHRPCEERFRHVLTGLTKKCKGAEDMGAYEELLAQSEAVFYHHPVLNNENKVTLLTAPRQSRQPVDGSLNYHPLLERFNDELWFLGDIRESQGGTLQLPDTPLIQSSHFPVKQIVVKATKRKRHTVDGDDDSSMCENETQHLVQAVKNPYNKHCTRKPFNDITNQQIAPKNPFDCFAHGTVASKKSDSYATYMDRRKDLRFTKRKFNEKGMPVNPNYKIHTREIIKADKSSRQVNVAHARESSLTFLPRAPEEIDLTMDSAGLRAHNNFVGSSDSVIPRDSIKETLVKPLGCLNDYISSRVLEEEALLRSNTATTKSNPPISPYIDHSSRFKRDLEEGCEPDKYNNFSLVEWNSRFSVSDDALLTEPVEIVPDIIPRNDSTVRQTYIEPNDECCLQSKHFSRSGMNLRRVTLDSPEPPLGEFEHTGVYVNLELSTTKPQPQKLTSPGCDSVLSEVDEMEAAAIPYQPPTVRCPHSTRTKGNDVNANIESRAGAAPSFSIRRDTRAASCYTPYQNNFNPILRHADRPRSRSKNQPTLFDIWDQNSVVSSIDAKIKQISNRAKSSTNQITSYFGYQSVVEEPVGDDDYFLGL